MTVTPDYQTADKMLLASLRRDKLSHAAVREAIDAAAAPLLAEIRELRMLQTAEPVATMRKLADDLIAAQAKLQEWANHAAIYHVGCPCLAHMVGDTGADE